MRVFNFLCCLAFGAALCGCREPLMMDTFEASLRILNKDATLNTGDALRFQVKVNRDTYILRSVECDSRMVGTFPEIDYVYENEEVFIIPATIPQTHQGLLAVVVEDPVSGNIMRCERLYTGRNVAEFSGEVLTPLVDSGDDLVVRVFCSHGTIVVRSIDCEYVFEDYVPGQEYKVGPDGYIDFVSRDVDVRTNGKKSVTFTVEDPESGIIRELKNFFETRKPTEVSMALVDIHGNGISTIHNGDDVYLRIYDTQEIFRVDGYNCEFGNKLNIGSSYSVSEKGYFEIAYRKVKIALDHDGTIEMTLYDPVHDTSFHLSCGYEARVSQ